MEQSKARSLLWAFFGGHATPYQKQILADWLREERNAEVYYQVLHEWEKANPQFMPDLEAQWQALGSRLQQPRNWDRQPERPVVQPLRTGRWGWLAAASLTLLITLGWWQKEKLLYRTYTTPYGATHSFILPDGSRVTLNANSSLRFPRFLALLPIREARLRGEAAFSVKHTLHNRPFLVHTPDNLEIRVLGTEFIVYSRPRGSRVVLSRGKVSLRSLKAPAKALTVRPGEVVRIDGKGRMAVQTHQRVADYEAWKGHRFVFDRTSLRDIAGQLEERFGVSVRIPNERLAGQQVSGSYPARTAGEVIDMLTRLLNIRAVEEAGLITLEPIN